jgi:hypothetical protein
MASDSDQNSDLADESRGKRGRSPNYPSVNIETAIKWARQVYDGEKRTPTTPLIVAQRCGFNGMSGPSRSAVSALKKYGLLVDADGDKLRVSDDAVRLFLQPSEVERLKIVQSMAMRPPIVRDILAKYPDGLPSTETLKYHLIAELTFTDDGAAIFLKLLQENVAFAKLDPEVYSGLMHPTSQGDEATAKPHVSVATSSQQQRPSTQAGACSVRYALSDGNLVVIDPTQPLTEETVSEVIDYLTVYKKHLSKKSQAVPPRSTED